MFDSVFETKKEKTGASPLYLPLRPADSTWEDEFKNLMQDDFLSRKYDRDRRIKDHVEYIQKLAPEIAVTPPDGKYIIDIGPGPGELLEIGRSLGYKIAGFDAKIDDCEMGEPYVKLSKLFSDRQELQIQYCGFENIIGNMPFEDSTVAFINSRGSIEQVFKDHLVGIPHRVHHSARELAWTFSSEMKKDFKKLLIEARRIMITGGLFLIYGNGSSNIAEYNSFILNLVESIDGLVCDGTDQQTIHRIRKA